MVDGRRALGDFGERLAAQRLEAGGMAILGRNLRTRGGEVDILARDGDDLVFVEVRTRRAAEGLAAESLKPVKLRRIWQCAMDYCESESLAPECVRIDVVTVELERGGRLARVEHFRGVDIPGEA